MTPPWHMARSVTVGRMPRTFRTSSLAPALLCLALGFGLSACSDDPAAENGSSDATMDLPDAEASNAEESCQAIVGSGAVEDIQTTFDKYKDNTNPFTPADEQKMRDALDLLAKAGDNAAPKIREDVVELVADMGSLIDTREGLPGVGKVATPEEIQTEIDALCR